MGTRPSPCTASKAACSITVGSSWEGRLLSLLPRPHMGPPPLWPWEAAFRRGPPGFGGRAAVGARHGDRAGPRL